MQSCVNAAFEYDGTFDGFLTAVFEAYAGKGFPIEVATEGTLQLAFGQAAIQITTDEAKARRVERGLVHKLGSPFYEKVWTVFLAGDPQKDTKLLRYIRHGLSVGRRVYNDLPQEDVLAVDKLYKNVNTEAHHFKMFLRFSQMEGGVFYGKISPVHMVIPLIMPHFADRYCVQPFIIHDDVHNLAGVYDLENWQMMETDHVTLPDPAAGEVEYRRLWKHFYDTVAIRERYNARCRMGFMPKRFWKNLTEMTFTETTKTESHRESISLPHSDMQEPVSLREGTVDR